jgi:hypothetical protein
MEHSSRICKNSTSKLGRACGPRPLQRLHGRNEGRANVSRWPERCCILIEIVAAQPCIQVSGKILNRFPGGVTGNPDCGSALFQVPQLHHSHRAPFILALEHRDPNLQTFTVLCDGDSHVSRCASKQQVGDAVMSWDGEVPVACCLGLGKSLVVHNSHACHHRPACCASRHNRHFRQPAKRQRSKKATTVSMLFELSKPCESSTPRSNKYILFRQGRSDSVTYRPYALRTDTTDRCIFPCSNTRFQINSNKRPASRKTIDDRKCFGY